MNKFVLAAAVSFLLLAPGASHAAPNELIFISSEEELIDALKADKIKGIAVRSEFYNKAGLIVKSQTNYLITLNLNKLVPVFFYGYDIKTGDIKKILGENEDYGCEPIIMAGIFWTFKLNSQDFRGEHERMCASGETEALGSDEEWFREWIARDWIVRKEELKKLGYATLN